MGIALNSNPRHRLHQLVRRHSADAIQSQGRQLLSGVLGVLVINIILYYILVYIIYKGASFLFFLGGGPFSVCMGFGV